MASHSPCRHPDVPCGLCCREGSLTGRLSAGEPTNLPVAGGELNPRPSLSSPFAPAPVVPPTGAHREQPRQPAASQAVQSQEDAAGFHLPTEQELNSRRSLPSPFETQPTPTLVPDADIAIGSGTEHRSFEGGELNPRPSLSSPFETKNISGESGASAKSGDSSISKNFIKVGSFDEWKSDSDSNPAASGEPGSTDLNPRASLPSPFETPQTRNAASALAAQQPRVSDTESNASTSSHSAPFEGGELNSRPSLASPFDPQSRSRPPKSRSFKGPADDASAGQPESATAVRSDSSPAADQGGEDTVRRPLIARLSITPAPASPFDTPDDSMDSPLMGNPDESASHTHVAAAHEAPLMIAALSTTPAPISPFFGGDDTVMDDAHVEDSSQVEVMSATMGTGSVPASPFGGKDEEPADVSAK